MPPPLLPSTRRVAGPSALPLATLLAMATLLALATLCPGAVSAAPPLLPRPAVGPLSAPISADGADGAASAATTLGLAGARISTRGMQVLGTWALLHIAAGGVGLATADDARWRGFHEGNLSWNLVNLGIAGVALWLQKPPPTDLLGQLAEGEKLRRTLSFNAGLDVAYVVAGAWLWERGRRAGDARQRGWGQALVLQGAFLLAFDLTLSWLQGRHDRRVRAALGGGGGGG